MNVSIDVEDESWNAIPGLEDLARRACEAALPNDAEPREIALLFTNDAEIASLNKQWRNKSRPTNVLSFPAPADRPLPAGEPRPLGDIVLAFETIAREAQEQGKSLEAHTTHLMVHGCLHLLGFDHMTEPEADAMEALEIGILGRLGIDNPYLETHERH